ncbi:aquaporin [Atractiella rhizophila]|nr:aquaporin [Atractiella rhizophila]
MLREGEEDGEILVVFNNPWEKVRHMIREPFAEFLGTLVLLLFGEGAIAQFVLERGTRGDWLSLCFGWGIGALVGIYVAGGISGAHLNPAVTVSLALFRRFPLRKVPLYIFAQLLGAIAGSAIVFAIFRTSIYSFEHAAGSADLSLNTVGIFVTGPQHDYVDIGTAFVAELVGTALLLIAVAAVGDVRNTPPSVGMSPMVILWVISGVGMATGSLTGFAINPARDLGPRMMASMAGYPNDIWTIHSYSGIWLPTAACISGGIVGIFLYDLFIYSPSSPS